VAEGKARGAVGPTLLINGDSDIVRPEHAVQMFRLLGGGGSGDPAGTRPAQLALLPGTSHEGILDRAGWLSSMIIPFLLAGGGPAGPVAEAGSAEQVPASGPG
jgi:pimeloyl-ACP methyl ester carboxylesterase